MMPPPPPSLHKNSAAAAAFFTVTCVFLTLSVPHVCRAGSLDPIVCDPSQNAGQSASLRVYNVACPPDRPYCTGSGLCSECTKVKVADCDCPPNYICVESRFNLVRAADFCTPYNAALFGAPCNTSNDCAMSLPAVRTDNAEAIAAYAVCVSNRCRYCDGMTENARQCQQMQVPPGADQGLYGSKNDGRLCYPQVNAWNAQSWPTASVFPQDPYVRELSLYASGTVQPSASATPSMGSSVGAAGASVSPSKSTTAAVVSSDASALLANSAWWLFLLASALCYLLPQH